MEIRLILASAVLGASTALVSPAFAAMPEPMHQGDVPYVTGGIGLSNQHTLEAEAKNYDLAVTNANKAGDFTGPATTLVIRAKNGRDILHVTDSGPLFYAKLPAGDYALSATNDGKNQTRDIKIMPDHAVDVLLIWPQQG